MQVHHGMTARAQSLDDTAHSFSSSEILWLGSGRVRGPPLNGSPLSEKNVFKFQDASRKKKKEDLFLKQY